MTLAAALAAGGMRPASFLPTVKCSDCGHDIEITRMGEHICTPNDPMHSMAQGYSPPNMSNPYTLRQLNGAPQQHMSPPFHHNEPITRVESPPFYQHEPFNRAASPSFYQNEPITRVASPPFHQHEPITRVASPPFQPNLYPPARSPHMALPKINPEAANGPFLAPTSSVLASPRSPAASVRSGMSHGARPRLYDPRPPSTEISANMDCAFPPFPATATPSGRRPSASTGRKTPNGSERAPSRGGSRLDQVTNMEPEPFNLELKSPLSSAGDNMLQRLNSVSDGPFSGNHRMESIEPQDETAYPGMARSNEHIVDDFPNRPGSAESNYSEPPRLSTAISDRTPPDPRQGPRLPMRPDGHDEDMLTPSFLGQFSAEPGSMASVPEELSESDHFHDRSNTFPVRQDSHGEHSVPRSLSRMQSEPALGDTGRRPLLSYGNTSEPAISRAIQSPPPRSDSINATARLDNRLHDAPPVPKAVQQYRKGSGSAPSESGSSVMSGTNSTSITGSSGASPVGSMSSSLDTFSPISFEARRYVEDDRLQMGGLNMKSQDQADFQPQYPVQKSPPTSFARPYPAKDEFVLASPPLESPMDPSLMQMQDPSGPTHEPWRPSGPPALARTQTAPGPVNSGRVPFPPALSIPQRLDTDNSPQSAPPAQAQQYPGGPGLPYSPTSPVNTMNTIPGALRPPPTPQGTRKPLTRRTTNAKPMCRGCGQMIEGKSVKAADGRLTGRWHKSCFVCRSCREPFMTADFYVINNEPYCEQHYHEQNGSLCNGCSRGIEGQYIETSSSTRFGNVDKKFHPRCFTCQECRMVLAHDYFEITGSIYCERHALAAMRAQARMGPGLNPQDRRGLTAERRTTRLMMMMA